MLRPAKILRAQHKKAMNSKSVLKNFRYRSLAQYFSSASQDDKLMTNWNEMHLIIVEKAFKLYIFESNCTKINNTPQSG